MKLVSTKLPQDVHAKAKAAAALRGEKLQEFLAAAVSKATASAMARLGQR